MEQSSYRHQRYSRAWSICPKVNRAFMGKYLTRICVSSLLDEYWLACKNYIPRFPPSIMCKKLMVSTLSFPPFFFPQKHTDAQRLLLLLTLLSLPFLSLNHFSLYPPCSLCMYFSLTQPTSWNICFLRTYWLLHITWSHHLYPSTGPAQQHVITGSLSLYDLDNGQHQYPYK